MSNYHRAWFCVGVVIACTAYVIWTLAVAAWQ